MNRTPFIQQSVISILSWPEVREKPIEMRMDYAITIAEAAWEKLSERGYGAKKEKGPRDRKNWYTELEEPAQIAFDKASNLYRKCQPGKAQDKAFGDKQEAAKHWTSLQASEYEAVYDGIKNYIQSCYKNSIKVMYFQTFLSRRMWEGYQLDYREEKPQPVYDEKAARIKQIEALLKSASGAGKESLQKELDGLKEAQNG